MNVRIECKVVYPESLRNKVSHVAKDCKIIHGKQKLLRVKNSVIVICLVKNGEYYIQSFIDHYVRISIVHIYLMDNGSTDRTIEIAKKYDCVTVLECKLPFGEYKLAMREFLAETFGKNSWCLSVDIDEFWEFPFCEQISLTQFIHYLDEFGFTGCIAHQLDLFDEGVLSKSGKKNSTIKDLRYFDLSDVYYWRKGIDKDDKCIDDRLQVFFSGNNISSFDIPVMARGVRWFLFGITPILTKVALFKLVYPVNPFVKSSHRLEGAVFADVSCVLIHKILNQHLYNKAIQCAKEESYYNKSVNYKQIAEKLLLASIHLPKYRKLYQSVNDLIGLNFLHISKEYEKYVLSHKGYKVEEGLVCDLINQKSLPLSIPSTQPRGVFEKYLVGEIIITEKAVHICEYKLDEKGSRRFCECTDKNEVETVIGIARLRWKSWQDRLDCIKLQKNKNKGREPGKNRWSEIVSMVYSIKQGDTLPLPALVHPALHDQKGLRIIDGARRIIANIEASKDNFPVLVIKPK